jgi:hypothetical protein
MSICGISLAMNKGIQIQKGFGEFRSCFKQWTTEQSNAFILDYAPADRPKYIEAFFSNINWRSVEGRLRTKVTTPSAA